MPVYGFHPEALLEFAEATSYYLREASPQVADAFVGAVESAIDGLLAGTYSLACRRAAKYSPLRFPTIPVRPLLSLGDRTRTHYYLCCNAL
jgi:hypothetical protein